MLARMCVSDNVVMLNEWGELAAAGRWARARLFDGGVDLWRIGRNPTQCQTIYVWLHPIASNWTTWNSRIATSIDQNVLDAILQFWTPSCNQT